MQDSFDKRSISSLLNQDALVTKSHNLVPDELAGLASLELLPLSVVVHALRSVLGSSPNSLDIESFATELNLFRGAACVLALRRMQERVAIVARQVAACDRRYEPESSKQSKRLNGMCIFSLASDYRHGIARRYLEDPIWPDEKYWSIWFSTNIHESHLTPTPISTFAARALKTVSIMHNKLRDLTSRVSDAQCSAAILIESTPEFKPLVHQLFSSDILQSANICLAVGSARHYGAAEDSRSSGGEHTDSMYLQLQRQLYGDLSQPASASSVAHDEITTAPCPCTKDSAEDAESNMLALEIEEIIEPVAPTSTRDVQPGRLASTDADTTPWFRSDTSLPDDVDMDIDVDKAVALIVPKLVATEKSRSEQFLEATLAATEKLMSPSKLSEFEPEVVKWTPLPGGAKVESVRQYESPDRKQRDVSYASVSYQTSTTSSPSAGLDTQ